MTQPVILDVDTGVDDALALALALRAPEVEVIGVTVVSGNVPLARATANTLLVLDRLAAPAVPVVAGAARPLVRPARHAPHVHGADGLGGISGRLAAPNRSASEGAADFLLAAARRDPAPVVVSTGPLTNLAQALAKDAEAMRRLPQVIVMGGAIAVPGNATPVAEFNVWADPEAAAAVLGSGCPVTLVPLDVTEQVALPRSQLEAAARAGGTAAFLRDIAGCAMDFHRREEGIDGLFLHDPLAVGAAVAPGLLRCTRLPLAVECRGEHTAGMTVADRRRRAAPGGVRVCLEVDAPAFLRLFAGRVLGGGRS